MKFSTPFVMHKARTLNTLGFPVTTASTNARRCDVNTNVPMHSPTLLVPRCKRPNTPDTCNNTFSSTPSTVGHRRSRVSVVSGHVSRQGTEEEPWNWRSTAQSAADTRILTVSDPAQGSIPQRSVRTWFCERTTQ